MSNSLRDQLLKAGLVTEDQVKKSEEKRPKQSRSKPNQKKRKPARKTSVQKPVAPKPVVMSAEQKAQIKAHKQKIREFLREVKLNDEKAENAYNFRLNDHIKRIYLNDEQRKKVIAGELAILVRNERHYLLSLEHADKMRELDKASDIFICQKDETPSKDDPYSEFQVPDDLIW